MPNLTITLTPAQAQEVADAIGVATGAEAREKIVEWLKNCVKNHRERLAADAARNTIDAVDADFTGI